MVKIDAAEAEISSLLLPVKFQNTGSFPLCIMKIALAT